MTRVAILSVDQGTSNTKALLVAPDGEVLASRSRAMTTTHPRPGWAEQSAIDIRDAVIDLVADLVDATPDVDVRAIAIANQRETVVVWDAATGAPLGPAILWQCGRSADTCAALRAGGHEAMVIERSGLGLDPLFPAIKIAWLLDAIPDGRARAGRGELRCGTIDAWLVWGLTGGAVHATDHGNASRTQLYNLDTLDWDPELARLFDVPLSILPQIRASDGDFGTVAPGLTALPAGTPIRAVMGDSHAALFAHGTVAPGPMCGSVKATIGTGSSLMTATAHRVRSAHGLSSTIAWSRDGTAQHALEGNISVSGHAAAFATALLGIADEAALSDLAATVSDSAGVVFVPALGGLGAPHWCAQARGTISGMTLATRPAHVARATLEAIALQIVDVLAALEADLGTTLAEVSVDGGAARNAQLLQWLADLSGHAVVRPRITEASAFGVARMAFEALGLAEPTDRATPERFAPTLPDAVRTAIVARWHAAVRTVVHAARGETAPG